MSKPEFKTEWESAAYDRAFEAMRNLLDVTNAMSSGKAVVAGMLDSFVQEHRTMQQSGVRNIVAMLKEWGNMNEARMSDLRNKDAFAFAKHIAELDPMFANV